MVANKKAEITPDLKNQIAQFLMFNSIDTVVNYGKVKEAANNFGVSNRTVHRVWAAAKVQMQQGNAVNLISNKLGVPHVKTVILDEEKMQKIPLDSRKSIRALAEAMQLSTGTVGRWVKKKVIRPHTNAIKPALTEMNKVHRVEYSLSQLIVDPHTKEIRFTEMDNVVHIDEKWFYMSKSSERYYLTPEEEEPHRTCQSKRFIPKVMFMCAVCRPRISRAGEVEFDGKIGCWPFTKLEPAKRNSRNRVRGTLETKPIESITKSVIKACILNQIIPAIKNKWPKGASKQIIIQQDNAPPHIMNDDPEFRAAATADGWNMVLMCQPPNSPDTNINDLGWFRSIQSLRVDTASKTVDQLVTNVGLSFENLHPVTLNNVFLSLQACLIEILKANGQNNYKLPHMGKGRLIREGNLPRSLVVTEDLVASSFQFLMDSGNKELWTYDLEGLLKALSG